MKVLIGEIKQDAGQIEIPSSYTIGYLSQHIDLQKDLTVKENAAMAFAQIQKIENKLEVLNNELGNRSDYESDEYHAIIQQISDLSDKLAYYGAASMEGQIESVLKGLGFTSTTMDKGVSELSGGWQMRVQLAKILLAKPSVLLLDEPTNHLDIDSIIWLEKFLRDYQGIVLLISHDKEFLDNIVSEVYELDNGRLEQYVSNYSGYLKLKEERISIKQAAYENQQKLIADKERTIERFRAKASKASMAKSMEKSLEKLDRVDEVIIDEKSVRVMFPPVRRSANEVVKVVDASKSFGALKVFSNVNMEILRGERVSFVGQNGQGKSTLTKIIVNTLKPSTGIVKLGQNVDLGYFAQNQVDFLPPDMTPLAYMEQESPEAMRPKVRSILGSFLFSGEEVEKKIKVLSGGEKTRLAIARLLLFPINFLVLDEPTHHLDLQTKAILKQSLMDYKGTLLVVSHDRDLLVGLTDKTYEFRDGVVHEYLGDINYFLKKRNEDNMRAIEQNKAQSSNNGAKKELSREEKMQLFEKKKQVQKDIQKLERKIERLEVKKSSLEKDMAEQGFYERSESVDIMKSHEEISTELNQVMMDWEELVETFEVLEE
ncbi:ABC-F family ATP-binding cassette domain-containing protein [Membranihabitans marinus]